jgi:hypothetical protein
MFKIPRRKLLGMTRGSKLLGMTMAVFGFFTTLSIIITELRLVQPPDPGPRQNFTVKIHPLHPDPLPPLGGEGMIFMSGGDQIPVMIVCDDPREGFFPV